MAAGKSVGDGKDDNAGDSKDRKVRDPKDDNTVFIGRKDLMSYVLAVVTQFNEAKVDEVVVKARGRAISRAVDAAEIARQRFLPDVSVKDVKLGTEQIDGERGPVRVSSMEITLSRK